MIKRLKQLLVAVAFAAVAPAVSANVLDFDDLAGTAFFTSNYRGFQFGDNSLATNPWFYTDESSAFYVPHSGTHYIATDFTLYQDGLNDPTQPISRTTAFIFDGAWFTGSDTVQYQLYSGSSLVFTSTVSAALNATPIFYGSGYAGLVTGVVIVGHQGFYALDDFTFRERVAAVPEPETLPLLLAGLACLGFAAARARGARAR